MLLSRIARRISTWRKQRHKRETGHYEPEDIEDLKRMFLLKRSCAPIRLENVSFRFTNKTYILEGIHLSVNSDEIAVISGDSGTGKTTLLNIVASILKPSSGKVIIPKNLGFIFQDDRFLPWRNVAWNVALPLIYQGYSKKSALCFASYMLNEVGLTREKDKYPEELSGGMKKRLAFARCFARLPGTILMDEPFTGLHQEARRLLWGKFFDLLRLHPVPVIIVTHFPEEISAISNCHFYTLSGSPARLNKH
jgi:NitT/TauT family transport system ATP-binding protein